MSSSSGEGSPVCSPPGPESVACYEECITDETFDLASSSSPLAAGTGAAADEESSPALCTSGRSGSGSHGVPKSNASGRITKRGSFS